MLRPWFGYLSIFFLLGSDLGGSVRIPAMFCGITSLKPTSGRIPLTGQGSDGGMVGAVGLYNTIGIMGRYQVLLKVQLTLDMQTR